MPTIGHLDPFCGGGCLGARAYNIMQCMYLQLDTCHAGELYAHAFCYGKRQMMMDDTLLCIVCTTVARAMILLGYCITAN